ncbi:hypothetical protein TNCT_259421 [Trichonephila clavata]|uniref:Uncharacterized protein n=1 Tax=Trichonephila clavata TaxID=2740835 RepID=A0A8X6FB35_TRICU|nr:hypothetical protein TNCT_259421 [Trichonephila clavata]
MHVLFVELLASKEKHFQIDDLQMLKIIERPAACEIQFTRFLNVRNTKVCEIQRQVWEVNGPNIMGNSMVRTLVWQPKDGQEHVHESERSYGNAMESFCPLLLQTGSRTKRFSSVYLKSFFF